MNTEFDEDIKGKIWLFIAKCHLVFHKTIIPDVDSEFRNINIGLSISKIVFNVYFYRWKEAMRIPNPPYEKMCALQCNGNIHYGKVNELKAHMARIANECGLTFDNDPWQWHTTALPLILTYVSFSLRQQELFFGSNKIIITENDNIIRPIAYYGLSGNNEALLDGITFTPKHRVNFVHLIGPMTALISYLTSNNTHDDKVFLNACKNYMAHIPDIDSILVNLKEEDINRQRETIVLIADILRLTTVKHVTKATPPPNVLALFLVEQSDFPVITSMKIDGEGGSTTPLAVPEVVVPKMSYCGGLNAEKLRNTLTDSGLAAAALYKCAENETWILEHRGRLTTKQVAQAIFHCWWGSYNVPFETLKFMTSEESWEDRARLKNCINKAEDMLPVSFELIKLTEFPIITVDASTRWRKPSAQYEQLFSVPVFSGYRTVRFNFGYMPQQIPSLGEVQQSLIDRLRSGDRIKPVETVQWVGSDQLVYSNFKGEEARKNIQFLPDTAT